MEIKGVNEEIVTGFSVTPRERAIITFMGYPCRGKKPLFLESRLCLVRALLVEYGSLIAPRGIYHIFDYKTSGNRLILQEGAAALESSFLASKYGPSGEIGLFVVTIGKELEERAALLMKENRALESLALEAIASEAVEQAAHYLQRYIQKKLGRRLIRYSPGYDEHRGKNDWRLTEQKVLFSLLKPERIGVYLTDLCMMVPRKTVSAIIGERRN
jgi:hypothetical protein